MVKLRTTLGVGAAEWGGAVDLVLVVVLPFLDYYCFFLFFFGLRYWRNAG